MRRRSARAHCAHRQRKRQALDAISEADDDLVNTPAICRKSYVHETVLTAFETGALEKYAGRKEARGAARHERLMARVLAAQCRLNCAAGKAIAPPSRPGTNTAHVG